MIVDDFSHFLSLIKAMLPDAKWSKHWNIDVAERGDKNYLVAKLSDWPHIRAYNLLTPFPANIVPILYSDLPEGCEVPNGIWFLGAGQIWKMNNRVKQAHIRQDLSLKPEKCGEKNCLSCMFDSYFIPPEAMK